MKKTKKLMATLLCTLLMGVVATGCGNKNEGQEQEVAKEKSSISASGSSALLPLAKDAATEFKKTNSDIAITINGGGSGTGLKQVLEGSVDIGNSDVEATKKLPKDQAEKLIDHKICALAVVPIVHKELAKEVEGLTKAQLKDIFSGKISNWKDVGGPDLDIVLITRPQTSGTRMLFEEHIMEGEKEVANQSLETDDSGTLLQNISSQKAAIGYISLSYLTSNQAVSALKIDGVEPELGNIYAGKWPIWGYEHMYTKGEPTGAVKKYLEFIVSDDYGKRLEELGYLVGSKMTVK